MFEGHGAGGKGGMPDDNRVDAPADQHHDHRRGDLHDAQGFVARFGDALDVLPPEIHGHDDGKTRRGQPVIHHVMNVHRRQHFVDQSREVLARGHTADGPGQHVIEHERRNGEFRERASERFLHHAVNAAAHEHAAAFDVKDAHAIAEDHDREDEPGSGLAYISFGFTTRVIRGRRQVIEHDCGRAPKRNERKHRRGSHDNARNCDCR